MALVLFVALTYLSVAVCNENVNNGKKYGCIFSPNLCTPPKHCVDDGLWGSCKASFGASWNPIRDQLHLLKILRELESRGYGYSAIKDALESQSYRYQFKDPYQQDDSTLSRDEYLSALQKISQDGSLSYKSVKRYNKRSDRSRVLNDEYNDQQEFWNSEESSVLADSRTQKLEKLIFKAKRLLADNGMTLSDLTDKEMKMLAKVLADQLLKKPASTQYKKVDDEAEKITKKDEFKHHEEKSNNVAKFEPIVEMPVELDESGIDSAVVLSDSEKDSVQSDLTSSKSEPTKQVHPNPKVKNNNHTLYIIIIVVGATVLMIIIVTILSCAIHAYRSNRKGHKKFIGTSPGDEIGEDYQELCRQHYATKNSEQTENANEGINDPSVQEPLITRSYPVTRQSEAESKHVMAAHSIGYGNSTRNSSVSSTSWSEEPVTASLDISTGHAVLSYMEDHLNNKDRLDKEWEDICAYEAESITTAVSITPQNSRKNRSLAALPYDHNRIKLKPEDNHLQSDYINASAIIDNDPKRPLYIAAQGPLASTIPDFWQMMWEKGCVAIVMLTPLVEEGVNQCARYWPDEGSCTYHNFEIHLVSEHIWCEDYLVRSLYLKHLPSGETRTVTQFHFLSWPNDRVPSTAKPLLELRRKVTKCYKGHNSPVLVHCSDGVGRTGTYILLDLAIDRMLKGAKEIDIAATLEHIRDQRVGMVRKKEQFEFALTAVAEEVNAILKALLR